MIFFSFENYEFDYNLLSSYVLSVEYRSEYILFWVYDGSGHIRYDIPTESIIEES